MNGIPWLFDLAATPYEETYITDVADESAGTLLELELMVSSTSPAKACITVTTDVRFVGVWLQATAFGTRRISTRLAPRQARKQPNCRGTDVLRD